MNDVKLADILGLDVVVLVIDGPYFVRIIDEEGTSNDTDVLRLEWTRVFHIVSCYPFGCVLDSHALRRDPRGRYFGHPVGVHPPQRHRNRPADMLANLH